MILLNTAWLRFQVVIRKQSSSFSRGLLRTRCQPAFCCPVPISLLKSARADDMESRYKTRACYMVCRWRGWKETSEYLGHPWGFLVPEGFLWLEGAGCAGAQSCCSSPVPPAPWAVSKSRPPRDIIMTTLEIIPLCPSPCIISNKPPRQPARRAPQKTVQALKSESLFSFQKDFDLMIDAYSAWKEIFVMESKLPGYKYNPTAWSGPRRTGRSPGQAQVSSSLGSITPGARKPTSVSFSIARRW